MNLSKITAKYIGRTFEDYGCIELIVSFMNDIGTPLPDEVNGITVENYNDLVEADIRAAHITMLKTFRKIGEPASAKYPAIGDLLVIFQRRHGGMFPAVSVGQGNAIASFIKKGVMVFKTDKWNFPIMARRIS